MSATTPVPDTRSVAVVEQELVDRAHAWMPDWQFEETAGDPGMALIVVASRMCGEVITRLARTPEKNQRGFIDWLGIQPLSPQAASMPLIFQLAPGAAAVTADVGTRVQASLAQPTSFETQTALTVVPGNIAALVAVDPAQDRYFLPSAGLLSVGAPTGAQTQWTTLADANYPVSTLQLSSSTGLVAQQILLIAGGQYRISALQSNVVTLVQPIVAPAGGGVALPAGTVVQLLNSFAPFSQSAVPQQQHALFIGDPAMLNLQGAAQIDIVPADPILSTVSWSYWGMKGTGTTPSWQPLDAPTAISDGITLNKPAGVMAPQSVDGLQSPWLRAELAGSSTATASLAPMRLRVRTAPDSADAAPLQYTAIYNNTPLVTDSQYFPLGLQPRTFDCFYLACAEAFGKAGALVKLNFDAGTGNTAEMAVWDAGSMLFGVAESRSLQRIKVDPLAASAKFLLPTQPTQQADASMSGPTTASPIFLNLNAHRPPLIPTGPSSAAVILSAGSHVWVWNERMSSPGFWSTLGSVDDAITGIVALQSGASTRVVVLSGAHLRYADVRLSENSFPGDWRDLPMPALQHGEQIKSIASVQSSRGPADLSPEIICVTDHGRLFHRRGTRWMVIEAFAERVDPDIQPLAIRVGDNTLYVVSLNSKKKIAAWRKGSRKVITVNCGGVSGFDVVRADSDEQLTIVTLAKTPTGERRVSWWRPLADGLSDILFSADGPNGPRVMAGRPAVISNLLVTSGSAGNVFVSPLDVTAFDTVSSKALQQVAVLDEDAGDLAPEARVTLAPDTSSRQVLTVKTVRYSAGSEIVTFDLSITRPDAVNGLRRIETLEGPLTGHSTSSRVIQFSSTQTITIGDTLMVAPSATASDSVTALYTVTGVDINTTGVTVSVDRVLHVGYPAVCNLSIVKTGDVLPVVVRPALIGTNEGTDAAKFAQEGAFYAADALPVRQGIMLVADLPTLIVLAQNWREAPAQNMVFDAMLGPISESSVTVSSSPNLQWEYWNGTAWWMLSLDEDDTNDLLQTGTVAFYSPPDLSSTSVQGKKDLWIRARLVAGDYGQETVTVTTSVATGGSTVYTVNRDPSSIHPPQINYLLISYSLCTAQAPAYVVSFDNGTYVNQSDANGAASNTVVTAFTPLAAALAAHASGTAATSPSHCGCADVCSASGPVSDAMTSSVTSSSLAPQRALYIGFDQSVQGNAVNLLWNVVENDFSASMPLLVAGVNAGGGLTFRNCGDQTRALGETELLTINIPSPMTPVNLFGQSLYWLCIQPTDSTTWSPTINAVFLNGVWSVAQETQTLELLGSSIGAPSATYTLLRPPVIAGSLQLRVRETLSAQDLASPSLAAPNQVISQQPGMPGNWVLWTQVPDPADYDAAARVYSLDSDTGTITFGDGLHGKVPPIARDNVVAFEYKRGGGAAANAFAPWGSLNLVTPVQGVTAVQGPQSAAGGADAEPPAQVITSAPSQIRQRDRAITPRDIEQLALQSSPDILQARSWQSGNTVKIVTVAVGTVVPSIEQTRALRTFLTARATPGLASVLQVTAPRLVQFSLDLTITVESFDVAAQLGADIDLRLTRLLDPQTGGVDSNGWPLGQALGGDDIAAALAGLNNMGSIDRIGLSVTTASGGFGSAPASFGADQYPAWVANGVQIHFQVAAA